MSSVREFLDLVARQADAVEKAEERMRARAGAPMRRGFRQLVRDAATRWALLSDAVQRGDTTAISVFTALFGSMRQYVPDLRRDTVTLLQLGVSQAHEADDMLTDDTEDDTDDTVDDEPEDDDEIDDEDDDIEFDDVDDIPDDIEDIYLDIDDAVDDKIEQASAYFRADISRGKGPDKNRLDTAVAIAGRSVNSVEVGASQVAVRAVSEGQRAVAKARGRRLIWTAERNACLTCLAYSGVVSKPGGGFPGGLTFGDKPRTPKNAVVRPPAHPNCRCTTTVYNPADDPGLLISASLKREAQRSVVKGWALESESNAARRRAAERLLAAGVDLPKSVVAEAQRKLRRKGRFVTTVPS